MHTKRAATSKTWPIPRKGTKYVVTPSHNKKAGIPLLIVIRDLLKFVKTKKEFKKIINKGEILVNNKVARKANLSLVLFDVIGFKSANKYYRITISKKRKIDVQEIRPEEAVGKIASVVNKKSIRGKKIQINLSDGRNILVDEKKIKDIKIGDSLLINFKDKKIGKHISLRRGAKIFIVKGKHAGSLGNIKEIEGKRIRVKIGEDEFDIKINELVVVE